MASLSPQSNSIRCLSDDGPYHVVPLRNPSVPRRGIAPIRSAILSSAADDSKLVDLVRCRQVELRGWSASRTTRRHPRWPQSSPTFMFVARKVQAVFFVGTYSVVPYSAVVWLQWQLWGDSPHPVCLDGHAPI